MRLLFTSICIIIFAYTPSFSQLKLKEHVWTETKPTTNIPDSLNGEDAIMIHYQHDIKNHLELSAGKAFNIESIRSRIKVNTQVGLENYSIFSFLKAKHKNITKLDARTIKKNGTVVDLNSGDIKILDIKQDADRTGYENVRISIPGAEVGDEIEIIYSLESDGFITSRDIHLYNDIPTLTSVFSYTTDDIIVTDFRMYNEMPDPVIKRAMKDANFTWTLTNLIGVGDQFASNFTEKLPFIRFSVRQVVIDGRPLEGLAKHGITNNNWGEIYDNYVGVFQNVNFGDSYKGKSFVGYMNRFKEANASYTIDKKVEWLVSMINDSMKIVDFNDDEKYKSMMYYIHNKKIDENNIHVFIKRFFQENNIKFYVAFGRERVEGVMDVAYASGGMITEIFYIAQNETGNLRFIYPSNTSRHYHIDELPFRVMGTDVVIVSRKSDNSTAYDVKKLKIPVNEMASNTRTTSTNIQVKLNEKEMVFKTKHTYTGDFSTRYREDVNEAKKAEKPKEVFVENLGLDDIFKLDTFQIENTSSSFPFNYNFNYTGKVTLPIQKVEPKVYSIPLKGLIDHYYLKTTDQDRILNYYCPFKYQDNFKVYLQFDIPVEIVENNLSDLWWFKPMSTYMINVTKINDKIIMVESKLDLRKDKLNPQEFKELHKVNESVKQAMESRILVKTL